MKRIISILPPVKADNTIRGMKLPVRVFTFLAGIGKMRSRIHVFAPNGGAGSITGMDLPVAGGAATPGIAVGFVFLAESGGVSAGQRERR